MTTVGSCRILAPVSTAEIISELPRFSLREKRELALALRQAIEDEKDIAAAEASYQKYLDGEPTMTSEELFQELGV